MLKGSNLHMTETMSRQVRECRQELRKFMREVKREKPTAAITLQYDKLYVDNKCYVWNDFQGRVMEFAPGEQGVDRLTIPSVRSHSPTKVRPLTSVGVSRSPGTRRRKVDQEYCAISVAAADLLKAVTQRSKEKVKSTMDALSAEAQRIEEEIEEFSSRTAKDVARLVTVISEIEDESENITKKMKCINEEIESLVKKKKKFQVLLKENTGKLEKLQAKKVEMDLMTDSEMRSLREKEREVKDILGCWTSRNQPRQPTASVKSEMVQFLKEAIAKKEEDLLCPVCLEPSKAPIFSCPDSHIICSTCVPKLTSQECPQCRRRVKLPDTLRRDRFAEKTAREYEELLKRLAKLTALDHHEELGEAECENEENGADADGKEEEEDQRGDFGKTLIFENKKAKNRTLLFRNSKTPKYSP